jgi:4'-phosphopantetheinyl transferase EntD
VSLCAVAVARSTSVRSIGIDLELDTPLSEKLLSRVLSPHEFSALRASERQAGIALPEIAKLVFSAKESAYKCQYPVTQTFLGFHDAECDVNWESETFAIRIVAPSAPLGSLAGEPGAPLPADFRLRGRFSRGNGHWATVVLLT